MTYCESEETFELIARDGDRRRRRVSRYDGSRHEIDQKTWKRQLFNYSIFNYFLFVKWFESANYGWVSKKNSSENGMTKTKFFVKLLNKNFLTVSSQWPTNSLMAFFVYLEFFKHFNINLLVGLGLLWKLNENYLKKWISAQKQYALSFF
jgi:hypothetical protein